MSELVRYEETVNEPVGECEGGRKSVRQSVDTGSAVRGLWCPHGGGSGLYLAQTKGY